MQAVDRISQQLSAGERLAVAWALLWPEVVAEMLVHPIVHGLAATGLSFGTLDLFDAGLRFFVVSPWVVRRAFALSYSGFRFEVVRKTGEMGMRYGDGLAVVWLFLVRTALIVLVAGVPMMLAWKFAGGAFDLSAHGSLSRDLLGTLSAIPIVLALSMWLVGTAVRKQYQNFSIRVYRTDILNATFRPMHES